MIIDLTSLELRKIIRRKYAWPGGHEIIFVTDDGATLCNECVHKNYYQVAYSRRHDISDGWKVVACCLDENLQNGECCDHCSRELNPEL